MTTRFSPNFYTSFIVYLTVESAAYKIIVRHALMIILPAHEKLTSLLVVTQITSHGEKKNKHKWTSFSRFELVNWVQGLWFIYFNNQSSKVSLSVEAKLCRSSGNWRNSSAILSDLIRRRFYRFECRFWLRNCRRFVPKIDSSSVNR